MFPKADFPFNNQSIKEYNKKIDLIRLLFLFNNEVVGFANFYEVKRTQYCAIEM